MIITSINITHYHDDDWYSDTAADEAKKKKDEESKVHNDYDKIIITLSCYDHDRFHDDHDPRHPHYRDHHQYLCNQYL